VIHGSAPGCIAGDVVGIQGEKTKIFDGTSHENPKKLSHPTIVVLKHARVRSAAVRDDVICASCRICTVVNRKAIIRFPAHCSGAKKAQAIFFAPRAIPKSRSKSYASLTSAMPLSRHSARLSLFFAQRKSHVIR
jgi:hypothetical protein